MTLKTKTALVTGSTSGIGLAIARALAAEGANIVLNCFGDAQAVEEARAGIESTYGVKARYSAADMSEPDAIAAMVREAEETFGAVDVLVFLRRARHHRGLARLLGRWGWGAILLAARVSFVALCAAAWLLIVSGLPHRAGGHEAAHHHHAGMAPMPSPAPSFDWAGESLAWTTMIVAMMVPLVLAPIVTAATRSLLNTAKLMEDNPLLLRLKELESLEKLVEKIGRVELHASDGKGLEAMLKDLFRLDGKAA